jgi:hypothetical protein
MMLVSLFLACAQPQWPEDGRQLLAWHAAREAEDAASVSDAAALRERIYVYQAAGAEAEAWAAADALETLAPADPDGDRYRVQLCVWDPLRWREGVLLAQRWLAQHGGRAEAEVRAVSAALSTLEQRLAAHEAALARQSSRGWVAWLAGALFVGGSVLAIRSKQSSAPTAGYGGRG